MKKVIHVLTDRNIGGARRWLLSMLRCADRENYETKVLLPGDSLLAPKVAALGFDLLEVPGMAEKSWDKASLEAMTELFKREKPDIVHVGASLTARIAARRAKVPVLVVTKHCAAQGGSFPGRMARKAVDGFLSDAVIAVSDEVGRELAASGTPKGKIHVIYNGITPIARDEAARESLREAYGLRAGKALVGIAARLEIVKGVDQFIDAAKRVIAARDDVDFVIFGLGSQEEMLRAQAADCEERIRFLGFCEQIEQALSLLDVCVVASRSEAFCLSAAEALSMHVPVAAFDVDGVGEVVRHEQTGLLVPAGDTEAMAAAIVRLLDDEALRAQLGAAGKKLVEQEFTASAMVRKTNELYEALGAGKGE